MKKIYKIILVTIFSFLITACAESKSNHSNDGKTKGIGLSIQAETQGLTVNLTAEHSLDKHIKTYDWDFGDGHKGTNSKKQTHTYNSANTYTVTLTAAYDNGENEQTSIEIQVLDPHNPNPDEPASKLNILHSADHLNVQFSAEADKYYRIKSYLWDFGDNSSHVTSANPVYTYKSGGIYTVKLSVTYENSSKKETVSSTILVQNKEHSPEVIPHNMVKVVNTVFSYAALSSNGKIYTWGANINGQLGLGKSIKEIYQPELVTKDIDYTKDKFVDIYSFGANANMVFALTKSGKVYGWGENIVGQLCIGNTSNQYTPQEINVNNKQVRKVIPFQNKTYFITYDNELYACGENDLLGVQDNNNPVLTPEKIMVGNDEKVEDLISEEYGTYHFILTTNKELYSFGWNSQGVLGTGNMDDAETPVKVINIDGKIKQIITEDSSAFAVTESGAFYSWGYSYNGRLGINSQSNILAPEKIDIPVVEKVYFKSTSASAEDDGHGFAVIKDTKEVYGWGSNQYSQLCIPNKNIVTKPEKVNTNLKISNIFLEENHTYLLTTDNKLFSCGSNVNNVTGVEKSEDIISLPEEVNVDNKQVKHIYSHPAYTFAITSKGEVYSWGQDKDNLLGINKQQALKPEKVDINDNVSSITFTTYLDRQAVFASSESKIYGWGIDTYINKLYPTEIILK